MKCIYYLTSTLREARAVSDHLQSIGVNDRFLHVVSNDEDGIKREKLPPGNYLETRDIIRSGIIGAGAGLIAGPAIALIMMSFQVFGPTVPNYAYLIVAAIIALFGAWEGGLAGIARINRKLTDFHDYIQANKYLILVYVRQSQERQVRETMQQKHPEAQLLAIDAHFLNPFTPARQTDTDPQWQNPELESHIHRHAMQTNETEQRARPAVGSAPR